jgi:hypothetical protein
LNQRKRIRPVFTMLSKLEWAEEADENENEEDDKSENNLKADIHLFASGAESLIRIAQPGTTKQVNT